MYAGNRYAQHPERAAFIMAGSGETVTYAEHEQRTNRLAHLLRAEGLKRLDHFAIFMENNSRYLECDGAGERSGLYYTCINSYLTPDELAYIVDNSQSQVLITSSAKLPVAQAALAKCPRVKRCLVVDGGDAVRAMRDPRYVDFVEATQRHPGTPIADEWLGTPMLYSSGTTGRPKGIIRPLPENPPSQPLPLFHFLEQAVAMRRRHALSVAGAAVPLGTAGQRVAGHPQRRHRGDHGALRSRAVPGADRAAPHHAHPARAHDVQPHAQAA